MRQLDRYIAVTVGNMMVAAVLGLVSVLTIFTFICLLYTSDAAEE